MYLSNPDKCLWVYYSKFKMRGDQFSSKMKKKLPFLKDKVACEKQLVNLLQPRALKYFVAR
jgi:hypothetical protein